MYEINFKKVESETWIENGGVFLQRVGQWDGQTKNKKIKMKTTGKKKKKRRA